MNSSFERENESVSQQNRGLKIWVTPAGKSNMLKTSFRKTPQQSDHGIPFHIPSISKSISNPVATRMDKSRPSSQCCSELSEDDVHISHVSSSNMKPFNTNFKTSGRISLSRKVDYVFNKALFVGEQEAKRKERQDRRQSTAMRNQTAIEQKHITEMMKQRAFEVEKSYFDSRTQDREAVLSYKQEQKRKARESLALRADIWRHHQHVKEEERQNDLDRKSEDAEWKRLDWHESNRQYKLALELGKKPRLAQLLGRWEMQDSANPLNTAAEQQIQGVAAQLLRREGARSGLSSGVDELHTAERMRERRSNAVNIIVDQRKELRAMEPHQAVMQEVHDELRASLSLERCELDSDKRTQGRVSMLLRLESWRQQRVREEVPLDVESESISTSDDLEVEGDADEEKGVAFDELESTEEDIDREEGESEVRTQLLEEDLDDTPLDEICITPTIQLDEFTAQEDLIFNEDGFVLDNECDVEQESDEEEEDEEEDVEGSIEEY
jgi:hypothetical protein